jgi:hypothetical protein
MSNSDTTSKSHDETDEIMKAKSEMTLDEMRAIVNQADEVEFCYRRAQFENWCDEQPPKARAFVEQLKRHLPVEALRELEEFASAPWACGCLGEALERDLLKTRLHESLPAERSGEIEQLVESPSAAWRIIREAKRDTNGTDM